MAIGGTAPAALGFGAVPGPGAGGAAASCDSWGQKSFLGPELDISKNVPLPFKPARSCNLETSAQRGGCCVTFRTGLRLTWRNSHVKTCLAILRVARMNPNTRCHCTMLYHLLPADLTAYSGADLAAVRWELSQKKTAVRKAHECGLLGFLG